MKDREIRGNKRDKVIEFDINPGQVNTVQDLALILQKGYADIKSNNTGDGAVVVGTPYSKGACLPDHVAALLGLKKTDPTIADAFEAAASVSKEVTLKLSEDFALTGGSSNYFAAESESSMSVICIGGNLLNVMISAKYSGVSIPSNGYCTYTLNSQGLNKLSDLIGNKIGCGRAFSIMHVGNSGATTTGGFIGQPISVDFRYTEKWYMTFIYNGVTSIPSGQYILGCNLLIALK